MHRQAVRVAKTGCIIASSVLIALGLVMIVWPRLSISLVGIIAGIMLVALGGLKLIGYFSRDLYRLAFQYDLAFGILLMMLGVLLLTQPESILLMVCLIVGISIAGDGLLKIQTAMEARKFGLGSWWLILLLGILAAIFGIATAFHPFQGAQFLMRLIGASLLVEGVMNLCVSLCAIKTVRDSVIETDFED